MAVPKGKVSKQRRNKRRSSVWKLDTPNLAVCACGEYRLQHRACKACGKYGDRQVIEIKEAKKA